MTYLNFLHCGNPQKFHVIITSSVEKKLVTQAEKAIGERHSGILLSLLIYRKSAHLVVIGLYLVTSDTVNRRPDIIVRLLQ